MGNTSLQNNVLIITDSDGRAAVQTDKPLEVRVREELGELSAMIAGGKPLREVVEGTLSAISRVFGVTEILFHMRDETLQKSLKWVSYGLPYERAVKVYENKSAEYHPQELIDKTMSEKYRISGHGFYVPAEEWLQLIDGDPFADHPAYYKSPEDVRFPRKSPDEWHEADLYKFALHGPAGELLATIELDYSIDSKLLSKEKIQSVELFTHLLGMALEREKIASSPRPQLYKTLQRTDLLEDVLRISSSIVSERDLRKLSQMILSSVSSLFGFEKVSLVVYDEVDSVFKWMAVFGYSETAERGTRNRTIPTEVVMEDLSESRRIGKSVFLTRREEVSPRGLSYHVEPQALTSGDSATPGSRGVLRKGDYLAFGLHDSTGRIVGVIYPSEATENRLPDKDTIETIEIFTSLAEVALENARLTQEREHALRLSSQRTEQLSRILDLATGIMYVRDLDQMLDSILKTLARLLGIKRMAMGVKHADEGVYKVEALYGYTGKAAEAIRRYHYPINQVDTILDTGGPRPLETQARWWIKMGRMTYYMPVESQKSITPEELAYYPEPELIKRPRTAKGHWHELDYLDTIVTDKSGVPIAYLELLKPRDERVPDAETIEVIEIFASLAGIAIENARLFQDHVDSRRDSELYTDVLSHDIKNFNQAILGYLDLLRMKAKSHEISALVDKIAEQVMNTSWLASNVRTMSRVTFGDVGLIKTDLGAVLLECERSITQYYPGRNVTIKQEVQRSMYYTEADELIREVFINILTNAVKYDPHEPLEIEISIEERRDGDRKFWTVAIADRGRGIPDDAKDLIFDRFSKAAKKKGTGMGLHIVKTLVRRYGGRVWVEDRVQGDHTQGAVFKLDLPAVD
ncbi:MAG TPA: ATP-binding protein [Thermoplasmata archaeon]